MKVKKNYFCVNYPPSISKFANILNRVLTQIGQIEVHDARRKFLFFEIPEMGQVNQNTNRDLDHTHYNKINYSNSNIITLTTPSNYGRLRTDNRNFKFTVTHVLTTNQVRPN